MPPELPGRRRALAWAGVLALGPFVTKWPTAVAADVAEGLQLSVERSDSGVYLSAQWGFDLPTLVEDALLKGIPVHFVAEADLLRERWYWADRTVASAARHMRLAYQPLTRRWRLQVSPQPIGSTGLGTALSQQFDDLPEAMASIQRIARWRLADAADVEAGAAYSVDFSFRLDTSQLPRALQVGVIGRSDWNLSARRRVRLLAEDAR